jgi:hypothetical protein
VPGADNSNHRKHHRSSDFANLCRALDARLPR